MKLSLYFVGFFSAHEPGTIQRWRPREEDDELVPKPEADKRFDHLATEMRARRKVDGLRVASVALYTESGDAIRSMTADGTEATPMKQDAAVFLQTRRVRCTA